MVRKCFQLRIDIFIIFAKKRIKREKGKEGRWGTLAHRQLLLAPTWILTQRVTFDAFLYIYIQSQGISADREEQVEPTHSCVKHDDAREKESHIQNGRKKTADRLVRMHDLCLVYMYVNTICTYTPSFALVARTSTAASLVRGFR